MCFRTRVRLPPSPPKYRKRKYKTLQNVNLQGFVFSRATPQNVKKRILPVVYSDCPFSHRYIGSHTVPSRRILAVFDRFLPAVRTGRRQLTIYRFFIFAECFYGLSTDRENIPAGNLYFWGWLARNGIDCPMQISSRRDDKRRGGRISFQFGIWRMERRTAHSMQSHSEGPSEFLRPSTDHRSLSSATSPDGVI